MKKNKLKTWMVKKLTACIIYAITYTFVICIGGCLIYNYLVLEKLDDRITALEEILIDIYNEEIDNNRIDENIDNIINNKQ